MYPEAITIRFDIPLSRDDSRLSHILHGESTFEMSPELCKGARAANYRQDRESIGHVMCTGRPRRRSGGSGLTTASLWHSNRKRDKGLVDTAKGTNPRE